MEFIKKIFTNIKEILTILGVLYFGVWITWTGYDSYIISENSKLVSYDIRDVELHGIGDNRYIEVSSAYILGGYMHSLNKKTKNIHKVIYSVVSKKRYTDYSDDKDILNVSVIILNDNIPSDCYNNEYCIDINRTTFSGVTRVGFDSLSDSDKKSLISLDLNLTESLVLIDLDSKPKSSSWYFIPIGIIIVSFGLIGLFGIFMGFREDRDNNTFKSDQNIPMSIKEEDIIKYKYPCLIPDNNNYPEIDLLNGDEHGNENEIILGRSNSSDIIIQNDYVSNIHVKIIYKYKFSTSNPEYMHCHGTLFAEDLGSTNGTYIDGEKLNPNERVVVYISNKIILGSEEVVYTLSYK